MQFLENQLFLVWQKKKKHEIIELHLLVGLAPHFWNHCPKSYLYNKGGLTKNRLIEPNGVQTGYFFLQTALGGSCDVLNINIYSMFLWKNSAHFRPKRKHFRLFAFIRIHRSNSPQIICFCLFFSSWLF